MEVALAFVAEAVPVRAVDIWSLAVCAVGYQCAALTAIHGCWSPSASVRRSARDASSVMAFTRCRWHGIHRGRGRCTSALYVVVVASLGSTSAFGHWSSWWRESLRSWAGRLQGRACLRYSAAGMTLDSAASTCLGYRRRCSTVTSVMAVVLVTCVLGCACLPGCKACRLAVCGS